jgi:hypothetical protein
MHTLGFLGEQLNDLANDEAIYRPEEWSELDIEELTTLPSRRTLGATSLHDIAIDSLRGDMPFEASLSPDDGRAVDSIQLRGPEMLLDAYWAVDVRLEMPTADMADFVTGNKIVPVSLHVSPTRENPNLEVDQTDHEYDITNTKVSCIYGGELLNEKEILGLYVDLRIATAAYRHRREMAAQAAAEAAFKKDTAES